MRQPIPRRTTAQTSRVNWSPWRSRGDSSGASEIPAGLFAAVGGEEEESMPRSSESSDDAQGSLRRYQERIQRLEESLVVHSGFARSRFYALGEECRQGGRIRGEEFPWAGACNWGGVARY